MSSYLAPLSSSEPDSFALADPAAAGQTTGEGRRREINLLGLAWRNRWLLLLMTIIGAGAAWALLQRVTPHYTSASRVFVERSIPQLLTAEMQVGQAASYLYTQAELMKSTPVLAAVAEAPANASLECFRDVDSPVSFLKGVIEVRVGTQDDIINVMAELPDPEEAAQLVNSVVEHYMTTYAEQRRNNAVDVLTILRDEQVRREAELKQKQQSLDEFRRQHAELAVQTDQGNVVTQRFASIADERDATEMLLFDAKVTYNRAKSMHDDPSQRSLLLEMATKTQQQIARDVDLERQVQEIEQQLAAERSRWGEGHPRIATLRETLAEREAHLTKRQDAIIAAYVGSLRQEYELLDQKRDELQAAYDSSFKSATEVSANLVQLKELEEQVLRTEKQADILDERIKDVNLTQEAGTIAVSVLEYAAPAILPSYPSRAQFLAIGVVLGGMSGLGLAWLRDLLDHRFKSVDEVAEALQLSVLGVVPQWASGTSDRASAGKLVATAPRCSVAEAVRTLRTALHFGLAGQNAKVIAVTSPVPGDGKSTVASNLAIAMAQADQRVLLIDGDMRKPRQHTIFDVGMERGLGSVLADRQPWREAIVPTGVDSLDILPCGPMPANPVELLNNGYFAELLEELRAAYDKIIIDSPPVMPVADARVIAAFSDATLLVLRAERSTRRTSIGARNELWRVRATRIGVVVNGVPARKQGQYSYSDGYGYGGNRYGGYGDAEEQLPDRIRKKNPALPPPKPVAAEQV